LIVEFIGLPGSGKSTLSHAVARFLRDAGESVSERSFEIAHEHGTAGRLLAKLRLFCRTLCRNPGSALALALVIARTGQPNWRDRAARIFELLFLCGLVAERSQREGIHLLDQGFFVGLWSTCFRSSSPTSVPLERLLEIAARCSGHPPADLVVVLEVEPATAIERLRHRPGTTSRLEQSLESEAGLDLELQSAVASLNELRTLLCAEGRPWNVEIVASESSRDGAAQASEVAQLVLAHR
jgi:thymidylate kinase